MPFIYLQPLTDGQPSCHRLGYNKDNNEINFYLELAQLFDQIFTLEKKEKEQRSRLSSTKNYIHYLFRHLLENPGLYLDEMMIFLQNEFNTTLNRTNPFRKIFLESQKNFPKRG